MVTLLEQAATMVKTLSEKRPGKRDAIWKDVDDLAGRLQRKPDPPTEAERTLFELFRQQYRKAGGTVRGLDMELKTFIKHKDWRDVLLDMDTNHKRQIEERKAMGDAGKMVPEWPHLQTYLNQRRWEMIYYHTTSNAQVREDQYTSWLRKQRYQIPVNEVLAKAMSVGDVADYKAMSGKFQGFSKEFAATKNMELFITWHSEYFNSLWNRAKYPTVTEYIEHQIKSQL